MKIQAMFIAVLIVFCACVQITAQVPGVTTRPNDFLSDTSFNVTFDGYYGYNFNRPVGGVNLLRAYYNATRDWRKAANF